MKGNIIGKHLQM